MIDQPVIIPVSNTDLAAFMSSLGETSKQFGEDATSYKNHLKPAIQAVADEMKRRVDGGRTRI